MLGLLQSLPVCWQVYAKRGATDCPWCRGYCMTTPLRRDFSTPFIGPGERFIADPVRFTDTLFSSRNDAPILVSEHRRGPTTVPRQTQRQDCI